MQEYVQKFVNGELGKAMAPVQKAFDMNKEKIQELLKLIMVQEEELIKVDKNYEGICREILRGQGVVVKTKKLEAASIFKEAQKSQ